MRPRKPFAPRAAEGLSKLMQDAKSIGEFRRVQCVWLRAALDMPVEEIAKATGLAPASVRCYHSRYLKGGQAALRGPGRGGRRNANLTVEEESALVARFMEEAESGGILEVSAVKRAYEQAIGHGVPKSTVYRMLARHGWRKLAPRPYHPKRNLGRQRGFKKNSLKSSRHK